MAVEGYLLLMDQFVYVYSAFYTTLQLSVEHQLIGAETVGKTIPADQFFHKGQRWGRNRILHSGIHDLRDQPHRLMEMPAPVQGARSIWDWNYRSTGTVLFHNLNNQFVYWLSPGSNLPQLIAIL